MEKKAHTLNLMLIISLSLLFKLGLFGYAVVNAPSMKEMPDTPTYVKPGINIVERGIFGTISDDGRIDYEITRTPGYPFFLGLLHKKLGLSFDGIILSQILLITLAGYLVYLAAAHFGRKTALIGAAIFLFDQPTTLASLMLLTEALYTFFIAVFVYFFFNYLKHEKTISLALTGITVALATFIRPISYYLGIVLAFGVLWFNLSRKRNLKRAVIHVLVMIISIYSFLGIWQYRNYRITGTSDFTNIDDVDLRHMGIPHKYVREGGAGGTGKGPVRYYAELLAGSTMQFFTLPGTFKYFSSKALRTFSKVFGYPWVILVLAGVIFAPYAKPANRYLLLVVLYYTAVSVIVVGLEAGSRFRVPVMPLISILSAQGWICIASAISRSVKKEHN